MERRDPQLTRRACGSRTLRSAAVLVAGSLATPIGGCGRRDAKRRKVVVAGPSMNPTLWGRHRTWTCPRCHAPAKADEVFVSRILADRDPAGAGVPRCWHCGKPLTKAMLDQASKRPADTVLVSYTRMPGASLVRPLDLVLAHVKGQLQIKRVAMIRPAARPDELSSRTTGSAMEGWSLEALPKSSRPVSVDIDRLRESTTPTKSENASRWRVISSRAGIRPWRRLAAGHWRGVGEPATASDHDNALGHDSAPVDRSVDGPASVYLQYSHKAVERGHRSSSVTNLYPGNLALSRRTERAPVIGVDLTVSMPPTLKSMDGAVQAAFCSADRSSPTDWIAPQPLDEHASAPSPAKPVSPAATSEGNRFDESIRNVERRRWRISSRGDVGAPFLDGIPLGEQSAVAPHPTRPITLRIDPRYVLAISDLVVWWRMAEPEHWLAGSTVDLPSGHCWLVGDNLPVSVDSRNFGPVPTDHLIGVVLGKLRAAKNG